MDYVVSGLVVTNATLTLDRGVTVGVYGSNGLLLQGCSKFVSEGAPFQMMNRFVRYHSVQEQANANWSGGTAGLGCSDNPNCRNFS
jgi:hypothetical protein